MAMDIDDGAVSGHRPYHCDSAEMNLPGPSGGRMSSDCHGSVQTPTHSAPSCPSPGYIHLSGSDDSPQLMIPPSPSSPMNRLGKMGDTRQSHGLVRQRRRFLTDLEPTVLEVTPRKRKRPSEPDTHVLDHSHTHGDASTDGANSLSARRIRPRLWTHQDREFSPLLVMSPGRDRDSPVEETIPGLIYSQNVTDPSHSIQRRFYFGNPREYDPCMLQSSPSPRVNDPEDRREHGRSESANSFAEVALATVPPRKHGRLSTLQDLWLPRPFEETEQPSVAVKVHERGLEAGPLFLSTNSGRKGGRSPSREPAGAPTDHPIREYGIHACSSQSAMLPIEPSSTKYFDKPICDSPDPIDPTDEDGLIHFELRTAQVLALVPTQLPGGQPVRRTAGDK